MMRNQQRSNRPKNMYAGKGWIKIGLGWGSVMYILQSFVFPYFSGEVYSLRYQLIGIPIWIVAGLAFGYTMKIVTDRRERRNK